MEFPNGPMSIDMLLIASLVINFVFLMLIIGASIWLLSGRAPEKRRAAPHAPAPRPHGARAPRVADRREARQSA
jgi:hypothetical protein